MDQIHCDHLRNDDETKAWGYLQAIGYQQCKSLSLQLSQAETMRTLTGKTFNNMIT